MLAVAWFALTTHALSLSLTHAHKCQNRNDPKAHVLRHGVLESALTQ